MPFWTQWFQRKGWVLMISLIKRKTAELVTGECCAKFTLGMLKDIYKVSPLRFPWVWSCSTFAKALIYLSLLGKVDKHRIINKPTHQITYILLAKLILAAATTCKFLLTSSLSKSRWLLTKLTTSPVNVNFW